MSELFEHELPQYFTYNELKCPCCGKCEMDGEFMRMLYIARMVADIPFIISKGGGYRCEKEDSRIGSTSGNHRGHAVDIKGAIYAPGQKRIRIITALIKAGFGRIGIYETHIHVDNTPGKTRSMWLQNK